MVDTRSDVEFSQGHLIGSINVGQEGRYAGDDEPDGEMGGVYCLWRLELLCIHRVASLLKMANKVYASLRQ